MNLWDLKKGATVRLEEAAFAEIVEETEDGQWVKVRYLKVPENPDLEGTEDLCSSEEVLSLA